ncbi:MAG: TIR domain-containing protein [Ktedonobacteraceae bacterium]
MATEPTRAIKIFYCYAHEDEGLRNKLEKHLRPLKYLGLISEWHDRNIHAGTDWEHDIETHLNTANIILLLVSPDFISSEYCYGVEMQKALERQRLGEAYVIPIILRSVYWQATPIGQLQALPTDGKPVTLWSDQDQAFDDVARSISKLVKELLSPSQRDRKPQTPLTDTKRITESQAYHQKAVEERNPLTSTTSANLQTYRLEYTKSKADILLVTATEVEARAVLNVFSLHGSPFVRHHIGDSTYFDLGEIGGARTFLVQSEMGAGGVAGAGLVVYEGIKALSPSAVIMVGIAFGLIPQEQSLGDILVSRQLVGYELQKVEQGPDGKEIIRARGDRVQASPRLLSRLRASIFDWQGPKVHFGLVLSGDKLTNHINVRHKLLGIEPEAIGGEMEGTGVYTAAHRNKVDWILVKAICDWADGHKDDAHQQLAAENAARFLLHVLQQGGLAENGSGAPPPTQTPGETLPRKRAIGTILCLYNIHSNYVVAVAWEPGGNRIASAGGEGLVRVWEADTGHTLLTYRGHPWVLKTVNMAPTIHTIAWSPEGLRLASAGDGGKVYVWDAATGQTIALYEGHTGVLSTVFALAWSPDGKRIASACSTTGFDKTVHVWNAKTGSGILRYNSSYGLMPNFSVSSVAWSPQGDRIASTCGDKTIRLWDATTGQPISTFKTSSDRVYAIAWSPDGRRLALANSNSTAEILHPSAGRVLLTYRGHHEGIRAIAWSPDGSRLATASNDTTVQIWDATNGTCLYSHQEHAARTTSVAWSPDGSRIASASDDKTVQVWQAT